LLIGLRPEARSRHGVQDRPQLPLSANLRQTIAKTGQNFSSRRTPSCSRVCIYPGIRSTRAFALNVLEKKSTSYRIFNLKIGHISPSQQKHWSVPLWMRVVALPHTTVNATSQGLKYWPRKTCAQMSDFKPPRVLGNPYETNSWEDRVVSAKKVRFHQTLINQSGE
jgi:hypothetical protein